MPEPDRCAFCLHPPHMAGGCAVEVDWIPSGTDGNHTTPLRVRCLCQVNMSPEQQRRLAGGQSGEDVTAGIGDTASGTAPKSLEGGVKIKAAEDVFQEPDEPERPVAALLGVVHPPEPLATPEDAAVLLHSALALLDGFMATMRGIRDGVAAILATLESESDLERDVRFTPLNDRMWGEGNWIRCSTCPRDSEGREVYHHRDAHAVPISPE